MMALTRKRHRGLHLWLLAAGLLAVALAGLALRSQHAGAIAEGDVQFSVVQTPAGGSTVQVGSTVTFDVNATVSVAPIALPVHFEFDYPTGLQFISGTSTPPGVTCVDNTPGAGKVRCSYGLVGTGPRLPISMSFSVLQTVTTTPSQVQIVAGDSDGGPDTAADGVDDTFASAGTLTVFNSSNFVSGGSGSPSVVFEGGSTTYTATIQNNSGVATGAFNASVLFANANVSGVSCTTSGANGSALFGGSTASCSGSSLADGETLTITASLLAQNTANGADITALLSAPGLGISTATSGVSVDEVGLDFIGTTLAIGTQITVCTGSVAADAANDSAAGSAQPNNVTMFGSPSGMLVLQTGDFSVSGAGVGTVSAAAGCGLNQSGVAFTPSAGGAYAITANYNVGGSNTLNLTVGGGSNPVPTASLLSPSTANAGSAQFSMTISGSNFIPASTASWGATPLAITNQTSNSLTVTVPAALVASVGSASVTITNPAPGGGTTAPLTFTVTAAPNPVPTVSSLSPNTSAAASAQFSMNVTGTNFVAGSVVRWEGVDLGTTYNSPTSLTATVPAAKVAAAGAANVYVFNPAPGGGLSVTPQVFTITANATKLTFTTQPGAGVAGSPLEAQPVVAVQTAANATVTSDSATVVTLVLNGTGTLTCTGGLSKTATAGVATFAGCAVSAAGSGFTITASAAGLTSAVSGTFDVDAAPPTVSNQITVTNPTNAPIPRSRLTFAVGTGSIDASAVSFIIKRKSDGKYWNATTGAWEAALVLNVATHGSGSAWTLAITGEDRRDFDGTIVTLEARATASGTVYVNQTIPELNIR
jgi:hypothetical protein